MSNSHALEITAQSFLEAVRQQDVAAQRKHLSRLQPCLERVIFASLSRRGVRLPRDLDADDVASEVLVRLLTKPPVGTSANAMATLCAWVGRVAIRFVIDRTRQKNSAALSLQDQPETWEPRCGNSCQESRITSQQQLAQLRKVLANRYPRGLPVLDAMASLGWASSAQLAEATGQSPANIDQIRSRIRRIAIDAPDLRAA